MSGISVAAAASLSRQALESAFNKLPPFLPQELSPEQEALVEWAKKIFTHPTEADARITAIFNKTYPINPQQADAWEILQDASSEGKASAVFLVFAHLVRSNSDSPLKKMQIYNLAIPHLFRACLLAKRYDCAQTILQSEEILNRSAQTELCQLALEVQELMQPLARSKIIVPGILQTTVEEVLLTKIEQAIGAAVHALMQAFPDAVQTPSFQEKLLTMVQKRECFNNIDSLRAAFGHKKANGEHLKKQFLLALMLASTNEKWKVAKEMLSFPIVSTIRLDVEDEETFIKVAILAWITKEQTFLLSALLHSPLGMQLSQTLMDYSVTLATAHNKDAIVRMLQKDEKEPTWRERFVKKIERFCKAILALFHFLTCGLLHKK